MLNELSMFFGEFPIKSMTTGNLFLLSLLLLAFDVCLYMESPRYIPEHLAFFDLFHGGRGVTLLDMIDKFFSLKQKLLLSRTETAM